MFMNQQMPMFTGGIDLDEIEYNLYIQKLSQPYSVISFDHSNQKDIELTNKLIKAANELPELSNFHYRLKTRKS